MHRSISLPFLFASILVPVSAVAALEPLDAADGAEQGPEGPGSIEDAIAADGDAEAAPSGGAIAPWVPYPSTCYSMDEVASFVDSSPHSLDEYWTKHALAWKANLDPSVNFTQPPDALHSATAAPSEFVADLLDDREAGTPATYFMGPNGNVDPVGEWHHQYKNHYEWSMAFIALAVANFDTPVYVDAEPLNYQDGDMNVFGVERLAVATNGLPLGDACDVFDTNITPADCAADIGSWWAIGEVQGVAFDCGVSTSGDAWRTTMSGWDLFYYMQMSDMSFAFVEMVYSADATNAEIQRLKDFAEEIYDDLDIAYDEPIMDCPEFALEDPGMK